MPTELEAKTYQVRAFPHYRIEESDTYIQWATEMLCSGYHSNHLAQLASLSPGTNSFEVHALLRSSLRELELMELTPEEAVNSMAAGIAAEALIHPGKWQEYLSKLAELADQSSTLAQFAQLYQSLLWIDDPQSNHINLRDFDEAKSMFIAEAEVQLSKCRERQSSHQRVS